MGQKLKAPKGEITVNNCDGRIRLRWRYGGNRYSLNLPFAYQPENMHYATVKVTEIKLDILKGCFDTSLKRYEYLAIPKPVKAKTSLLEPLGGNEKVLFLHELAARFNEWGKHIRNIDVDNSIDYLYIRKWLEKCIDVPVYSTAEKLNTEDWANTTYNRRLSYLNTFFIWLSIPKRCNGAIGRTGGFSKNWYGQISFTAIVLGIIWQRLYIGYQQP